MQGGIVKVEVVLELEISLLEVSVKDVTKLMDRIVRPDLPKSVKKVEVKDVRVVK
jgi:hypothetical protein